MKILSTLLCSLMIGQTDSKMEYSHDVTHGMKKLRQQAQKRLQATLLHDGNSAPERGSKTGIKLPNPRFIFHNKIPKSGSTTLANIVHTLEERNRFKLRHFHPCINEPCDKETDGRAHSAELAQTIKDDLKHATPHNPLIVIKHHLYTNFTASRRSAQ